MSLNHLLTNCRKRVLQKCLNLALHIPLTRKTAEKLIIDLDIIEVFGPDFISVVVLKHCMAEL